MMKIAVTEPFLSKLCVVLLMMILGMIMIIVTLASHDFSLPNEIFQEIILNKHFPMAVVDNCPAWDALSSSLPEVTSVCMKLDIAR